MAKVRWYANDGVAAALAEARSTGKPVFVDFWSPGCKGCEKMEEVTYRSPAVLDELAAGFVAVKYNTKQPEPALRLLNDGRALLWSPTLVVLDPRGTEVRRLVGYVPPDELVAELELGRALVELLHGRSPVARERLAALGAGDTSVAAEATYWEGVAAWKLGGLPELVPVWDRIGERFPDSPWAARADCIPATARAGV
jgi:thiol-disulfide isomerase/thioredoxin